MDLLAFWLGVDILYQFIFANFKNKDQVILNYFLNWDIEMVEALTNNGKMSKKLSKNIAAVDYFDKTSLYLSATNGGVPIASFATIKKLLKPMRKKKKETMKLFQ